MLQPSRVKIGTMSSAKSHERAEPRSTVIRAVADLAVEDGLDRDNALPRSAAGNRLARARPGPRGSAVHVTCGGQISAAPGLVSGRQELQTGIVCRYGKRLG